MPAFYGAIDLQKNELRNAVVQNLGGPPATPGKGQVYFDSTANILYWFNGSTWVAAQGGAGAVPATTGTTQAGGDAPGVGPATTYTREDHKHGMPSFGNVVAETAPGGTSANGTASSVARSDHTHGNPAVGVPGAHHATHEPGGSDPMAVDAAITTGSLRTIAAVGAAGATAKALAGSVALHQILAPFGNVDMGGMNFLNLVDPTTAQQAATKAYVDALVQGLDPKASVKAATTVSVAAGGVPGGSLTIDGYTTGTGDRILVKDQSTPANNGIWITDTGASWSRAPDFNTWAQVPGAFVFVEQGTVNADTGWVSTADQGGTLNTTPITWSQFSSAGTITAGAGLTKTGNQIDVVAGDTSLIVNADEVHVNTSVIATLAAMSVALTGMAKKFAAALTGTASPETVTHNLNTRDVQVTVLNGASPYTAVEVDWDAATVNTVTVRYSPNLGAGYRVVVTG